MNRFLRGVARAMVESFALPDPVLEIGSYQVAGQSDLIDLRGLFPGRPYVGVDFRPGPGVDCVASVERLPQATGSVGTVIAFSTFEHVQRFWVGFKEVNRVLRPDGLYKSQTRFGMYRWHVMDPIRFERDLRVTIQALGWRSGRRYLPLQDDIASTAFYYMRETSSDRPALPDADGLEVI